MIMCSIYNEKKQTISWIQTFQYVMEVMVPETLIRLTMAFYGMPYDEVGCVSCCKVAGCLQ